MTLRALQKEGEEILARAGVAEASHDARALLLAAAQMDLQSYSLHLTDVVNEDTATTYRAMLSRRASREPLQYILGVAPFFGRDFFVSPATLIPRFDSETLVAAVLPHLKDGMALLDLCTGSGCLLLTLLAESGKDVAGTGSDISEEALVIAEKNARTMELAARFLTADLFEGIPDKYDIIISNPPYIRAADIDDLSAEVRSHEPRAALDGGADGLVFYRRIAKESPAHLVPGGRLFLEVGATQGAAVVDLLKAQAFSSLTIEKDLGGNDRVVSGVYAEQG